MSVSFQIKNTSPFTQGDYMDSTIKVFTMIVQIRWWEREAREREKERDFEMKITILNIHILTFMSD